MKVIMYHYVRNSSSDFPELYYLHKEDFIRQLDYFANEYGFVSREEFSDALKTGIAPKGVVLTFDDGLREHYNEVFPVLLQKGLWGAFYISTAPYKTRKLLDVHRIHVLLGRYGGQMLLSEIRPLLKESDFSFEQRDSFREASYEGQNSDQDTTEFKRIMNYYLEDSVCHEVLDHLMGNLMPNERTLVEDFYLDREEIKKMVEAGMVVGSHTSTHPVMSKLSLTQQGEQIRESFNWLTSFCDFQERSYCHPYGRKGTFNEDTFLALDTADVKYAFSVDPRDVSNDDLANNILALPRYDCNLFPYGKASQGGKRTDMCGR